MTELLNSMPVTGQRIDTGRHAAFDDRVLYVLLSTSPSLSPVCLSRPMAVLETSTSDSHGVLVPDPFDLFDGNFFEPDDNDEQSSSLNSITVWSISGGNDELATLYDIEPGT